jgi:hypothetical protein
MNSKNLELETLPETFAISKLSPIENIPSWAVSGSFYSISKTSEELSVVCEQKLIPEDVKTENGWRCLKVKGPLDFSLSGILSSLAYPLAENSISIFAISTFDTDYLLIKEKNFRDAVTILRKYGHRVQE